MESPEQKFVIKREPEEEEQPLTFTFVKRTSVAVPEQKFTIKREPEEENEDE